MSSSLYRPCGCTHTFSFGKLTNWTRCEEHYDPKTDDVKILEAATNLRRLQKQLREENGQRKEGS